MNIVEELVFYNYLFLFLLGNFVVQDDLDSFQKVLKEIYFLYVSFFSFRKNKWIYFLMGYVGLYFGMEISFYLDCNMRGFYIVMGICVGLVLSMGIGKYVYIFLLQIIDFGVLFFFLIKDVEDI